MLFLCSYKVCDIINKKKIGLKCYVIEKIYGSYSNIVFVWG